MIGSDSTSHFEMPEIHGNDLETSSIRVERHFFACKQLLQRHNRKWFLHRIAISDEKWVHYDNPKCRKSWGMFGHASTLTAKPNIYGSKTVFCIWRDQFGVVYYELFKPSETIIGGTYQTQLMRFSRVLREKRPQYQERHDIAFLQHDDDRLHVARPVTTYLKTWNN